MFREESFTVREITPFEQLIVSLLCEGKSNICIARDSNHTEKVIENTISRSAKAFGITSDGDTNIRVLLALAYRAQYGDTALDDLLLSCIHLGVKDSIVICDELNH